MTLLENVILRRGWFGPLLSALLLSLAFYGAWPLVFVALVPLLLSLRDCTPRQAWNRGYGFGLLFSLGQLWWLGDLAYKWLGNPILGVVPWLLASFASAVYYGLLGRLIRSCGALNALWAIPLVWAGMEVFRSYIPVLAFPWALLAEPLMAFPPLSNGAWLGTIFLVSGLVVGANLVVLLSLRERLSLKRRALTFALIPLLFLFTSAIGLLRREELGTVAAGQIGVDMAFDRAAGLKVGPAVEALATEARGIDLTVLSEGLAQEGGAPAIAAPFTGPVVFGAQRGTGPVYQSAFAHDARGWTHADKTRLVIFGEFVPGRDLFPFIGETFHLPGGDLSAGDKLATVRAGRLTVGPLICFEGLFPDLALRQARAGADVLAVMSIDDWFHPWAKARLARAAQWRAVEAGLPLVRAGSMGRSMVVSAHGRVLADEPYGERRLVVARIRRGQGPFVLVWLFPLIALGSLVAIPFWARRTRVPLTPAPLPRRGEGFGSPTAPERPSDCS